MGLRSSALLVRTSLKTHTYPSPDKALFVGEMFRAENTSIKKCLQYQICSKGRGRFGVRGVSEVLTSRADERQPLLRAQLSPDGAIRSPPTKAVIKN